MSYIYEALKRAEDERQQGAVTVRPAGQPLSFVTRPPWWVWGVLAALIANVALLVALTFSRAPSRAPAAVVAAVPLADSPVKAEPPRALETPARRGEPRSAPSSAAAVVPNRPVVTPPAEPRTVPRPIATSRVEPPAAPAAPVITRVVPPAAAPPPSVTEPPPPRERTTTVVTPSAPVAVTPVPAVAAPDSATSNGAPDLVLQVLVYSDIPSQRMVFVNGRRYVEGDPIDVETTLERITPDGAVVNRLGQRFTITDRRDR